MDLDQGLDLRGLTDELRAAAARQQSVPGSALRVTRDCRRVFFPAGAGPVAAPFTLESFTFQRVCEPVDGLTVCRDRLLRQDRKEVFLSITGAWARLPWQEDAFLVCLRGEEVSSRILAASRAYEIFQFTGPQTCRLEARVADEPRAGALQKE